MSAIPCLPTRQQHSFRGSLKCEHCGAPDVSHRSPTPIERAYAQGKIDRRKGKSLGSVPYADRYKADAWEIGWRFENKRLNGGA